MVIDRTQTHKHARRILFQQIQKYREKNKIAPFDADTIARALVLKTKYPPRLKKNDDDLEFYIHTAVLNREAEKKEKKEGNDHRPQHVTFNFSKMEKERTRLLKEARRDPMGEYWKAVREDAKNHLEEMRKADSCDTGDKGTSHGNFAELKTDHIQNLERTDTRGQTVIRDEEVARTKLGTFVYKYISTALFRRQDEQYFQNIMVSLLSY